MDGTDAIMDFCREQFPNERWGISTTQQMLLGNAMRDNFQCKNNLKKNGILLGFLIFFSYIYYVNKLKLKV